MSYSNKIESIYEKFSVDKPVSNLKELEDGSFSFYLEEGNFLFSKVIVNLIFFSKNGFSCEYRVVFITRKKGYLLFRDSLFDESIGDIDLYKNKILSLINKKKIIFGSYFYAKSLFKIFPFLFMKIFTYNDTKENINDTQRKEGSRSSVTRTGYDPSSRKISNFSASKNNTLIYRTDKKNCATCLYWQGQRSFNSHGSIIEVYPNDAICQVSKMTTDPITKRLKSASTKKTAPSFGISCKYHRRIY